MQYLNDVTLQGRVVYLFHANCGCEIVTLAIGDGEIAKVICFGECAEKARTLNVNDYIKVISNLQSSNKTGKYTCSIFADSIFCSEPDKRINQNSFCVSGYVKNVISLESKSIFIVNTLTNGRFSRIPLHLYSRTPEEFASMKDTLVKAYGHVEIRKHIKEDGTVQYQELYIIDQIHEVHNHV